MTAIRAFVRIVETGSFTQASQSLGVPKPTVTKLIQSLEAHLRTKLLSRTTRRMAVTADGAAYFERAVRLLSDLDELDGSVTASQARPKGRLRVDVSSSLAQLVIIPALGSFFERYPDIQLEIGSSDRQTDMVAENVDCVIRAGELADASLIARQVAVLPRITCAAPSYLRAYGMPAEPADLARNHFVVGYFLASSGRPRSLQFSRGEERLEIEGRYQAAVNDAGAYLVAGLCGRGVLQIVQLMVRQHLQDGSLLPVLGEWALPPLPVYVVYPPNRHLSAKLRIFVDWVAGLFAQAEFRQPD